MPGRIPAVAISVAGDTHYEHWSLIWYCTSALAGILTLVVIIAAATLTYRQIREASRSRQVDSLLAVLRYVDDADLRSARKLVYDATFCAELSRIDAGAWSEASMNVLVQTISSHEVDWRTFRRWLGSLENVAMLVMHDLAHDDVMRMYFGESIQRHWKQLQPIVKCLRNYYGNDHFLQHIEMMNRFIADGGFRKGRWARSRLKHTILKQQLKKVRV